MVASVSRRTTFRALGIAAATPITRLLGASMADPQGSGSDDSSPGVNPDLQAYILNNLSRTVAGYRTQGQSAEPLKSAASYIHLYARQIQQQKFDTTFQQLLSSLPTTGLAATTFAPSAEYLRSVQRYAPNTAESDLTLTSPSFSSKQVAYYRSRLQDQGLSGSLHELATALHTRGMQLTATSAISFSPATYKNLHRRSLLLQSHEGSGMHPKLMNACWSKQSCKALLRTMESQWVLMVALAIMCAGVTVATGGATAAICGLFWADSGMSAALVAAGLGLLYTEECT